ncbi:MAG TPA: carbohydrate binding domain-containing protein [Verrucomicrobiae bacterium]
MNTTSSPSLPAIRLGWLLAVSAPGLPLWTASAAERFPFVVPGDDATASATDFSGLSPKAAGADGFVHIQDDHFFAGSSRLKIWGVNLCFGANFPTHEDAEKVAAHLAKLGINGVRMHHHDTAAAPRGVWGPVTDGRRTLDPVMLERQDYLLDQLHRHGIYANLNLHVGRTFTAAEGFATKDLPASVQYSKYLIYFEPRMRELLKEFCRDYLTHTNKHRGLSRASDPGIAVIELSNENSFSTLGPDIAASLPEPYRGEFKQQWNRWLIRRYPSTDALKKAWGTSLEPLGPSLVEPAKWQENLGGWRLNQSAEFPVKPHFDQAGPQPSLRALQLEIPKAVAELHRQELQFPNLTLQPSRTYTLSFWLKADAARPLYVDVSNQGPDNWQGVGVAETVQAGPEWALVTRVFRSADKIPGKARICFKFGGNATGFSLAGARLQQGGEFIVVPAGQSLEKGDVEIPASTWCEAARRDARQFMADTEKGFIRELTAFLRKDLGVRVPITASQITYHGAEIVAETCDYADIHAYWQHPHFPGRPWDPANWTIRNTPMEQAPDADSLLSRAPWRLLDRPFTISEWNIPDPHDCAASTVPFAAMVAALQDWDGVFFFDYYSSESGWDTDRMRGYFSFNGQPVKLALLAACANLYRRGDLKPLPDVAAGTLQDMLPATLGLGHRIGIDPKATLPASLAAPTTKRLASPDGRAVWDAGERTTAHVLINTPNSRAVWGLIAGQKFDLGGIQLALGATEHNYAALIFTSLDGKPLEKARRILLAAVGSAENQGMEWNDTRTSVGNKWGTGPTLVNGIAAEVTLPFRVKSVQALDGRGQPQGAVPVRVEGNTSRFTIGPEHRTLWYEIE